MGSHPFTGFYDFQEGQIASTLARRTIRPSTIDTFLIPVHHPIHTGGGTGIINILGAVHHTTIRIQVILYEISMHSSIRRHRKGSWDTIAKRPVHTTQIIRNRITTRSAEAAVINSYHYSPHIITRVMGSHPFTEFREFQYGQIAIPLTRRTSCSSTINTFLITVHHPIHTGGGTGVIRNLGKEIRSTVRIQIVNYRKGVNQTICGSCKCFGHIVIKRTVEISSSIINGIGSGSCRIVHIYIDYP